MWRKPLILALVSTSLPLLAHAQTQPAPSQASKELATPGFFYDLAATAIGNGLDSPTRLPPRYKAMWDAAITNETNGNLPATLDSLRALDTAFSTVPHGLDRLDKITRREKQIPFAQWLAETHANALAATLKGTSFDLRDVRDIEKPALIGIFKERTAPALEPLKAFLPPIDDKTGKPGPATPDQLSGITIANAIEVKHQAFYAIAILLGQMTLEPDMPFGDRQLIRNQITGVRRVLSAASSLEPAARVAAAQAEREKRLADLRAKQEAARHPTPPTPPAPPVPTH